MEPFTITVRPESVIGDEAGMLVVDFVQALAETHGTETASRFVSGALGGLVGMLPRLVGDKDALQQFEAALAILRERMAAIAPGSATVQ
jgi:hypothetical protein